jgi:hypothetical protein
MFINQIDELIDKSLDNYFREEVHGSKFYEKLVKEPSFVKHQLKINASIADFITKKLSKDEIRKIVSNEDNVNRITDIVRRYIAYYILMWIAYHYESKRGEYVNNVMEMAKNQHNFNYRIANFFNSENNATLFKFYDTIKDVIFVVNIEDPSTSVLATKTGLERYKPVVDMLNDLGAEFVTENLRGKGDIKAHNLIKTLVFVNLYQNQEKPEVIRILEEVEMEQGEYAYIDVVMPKIQHFDYAAIEQLMSPAERRAGIADEAYEQLNELGKTAKILTYDDKINILVENGILVPITEDFLCYHKDTERYERDSKITGKKEKKGDDTKLRYIVAKLDTVSELFSENTKKSKEREKIIEKTMYPPMADRRVVLVNELEDLKIISKIHNLGKQTMENLEFYNDLLSYRSYPYVNFKNFGKNGISLPLRKTVIAVRSTSFENSSVPHVRSGYVETRVGGKDQQINIVGFMVRPLTQATECFRVGEVVDVRKFTLRSKKTGNSFRTDNGYEGVLKFLQHTVVRGRENHPAVYWYFDMEKDKFDLKGYEPISNANMQEYLKLLLAHMYDSISEMLVARTLEDLKELQHTTGIRSFEQVQRYIAYVESHAMPFDDAARERLLRHIYQEYYPKADASYDPLEDRFPGLDEDTVPILRLPAEPSGFVVPDAGSITAYPDIKEEKGSGKRDLAELANGMGLEEDVPDTEDNKIDERLNRILSQDEVYVNAICQHVLSWQIVMENKHMDQTTYQRLLYQFIRKWVAQNPEEEYICKSCAEILPMKHYIVDGIYDDAQERFVTFTVPMDIPLDEIQEYEKFSKAIKNIDKKIERICAIANINYYVGSTQTIKWRRKVVTKTVVDLLIAHNAMLKTVYKQRNEAAVAKYGIVREMSNLFFFELDNSVFTYSSKGRDFFRLIKLNNVTAYIIVALLMELNENQIALMGRDRKSAMDKMCNWYLYEKIGDKLVGNLRIIRNDKGDTEPIADVGVLGYVIYMLSCILTKNRIWFMEQESDKKVFDPSMQRSIIHTVLDLLNSILEVGAKSGGVAKTGSAQDGGDAWLYDMICSKLFSKMSTVYENPVLESMIIETVELRKLREGRELRVKAEQKTITPSGHWQPSPQILPTAAEIAAEAKRGYLVPSIRLTRRPDREDRFNTIGELTNCPDGRFHIWRTHEQDYKCSNCSVIMKSIDPSNRRHDEQLTGYLMGTLRKLSLVYCPSGSYHMFQNREDGLVCRICGRNKDHVAYSPKELDELSRHLEAKRQKINARWKGRRDDVDEIIPHAGVLEKEYGKAAKEEGPATLFLQALQRIVGREAKIGDNLQIMENTYIVQWDYLGNRFAKPIVITDSDAKINYKEQHPFFGNNVIYYSDKQKGIDVYYDAITYSYLGYKESNREYVRAEVSHHLQINWSLKTRLSILGFESMFIPIREMVDREVETSHLERKQAHERVINNIYRQRLINVKQIVGEVQKRIYQIKNQYDIPQDWSRDAIPDPGLTIVAHYKKMLSNIQVGAGPGRVYGDWKSWIDSVSFNKRSDGESIIDLDAEWASTEELAKADPESNLIIFYMCRELAKLLDGDMDKFTKANLANMVIELLNHAYEIYNEDRLRRDIEIKRFIYMLDIDANLTDAERQMAAAPVDEIYDEAGLIGDEEKTDPEEADEMFSMSDIEGGREMEQDEEFISDFSTIEDR